MADSCKQSFEMTIPVEEVERETERVIDGIRQKVKLPGFRPGKAPASIIRVKFQSEIRQDVLESLIPRFFRARAEQDHLNVVGQPGVSDVVFEPGQPLKFKIEFEVAPEFELGEYRGLTAPYSEPEVTAADVDKRLEELRVQKADFSNVDPRPIEDGDHAVVLLESLSGVEGEPVRSDDLMLHIGGEDTMPEFTANLRGASPGDAREFDVSYPAEFAGQRRLAGKTVRFRATVKGIRQRDLPDLNDEFAKDLGDYRDLEELRDELRKQTLREREFLAQQEAKNKLVEALVDAHEFPVPDAFVERQLDSNIEQYVRELVMQGVDPRTMDMNWARLRESMRDRAVREVRATLLLERIADREAIETTVEEVDREVHRIARQQREPAAAVRAKLEKDGAIRRIASRIRTDKTLSFLFEHARKTSPE